MTDKTPEQEFASALAAFQADMPEVEKQATGQAGPRTTKYADLAHIVDRAMPALAKQGLSYTAAPTITEGGFVLRYALLHEGGHREGGDFPLPSEANSQQIGSAISYARRYCLLAVTGLAPKDDDDDGHKGSEVTTSALPRAPRKRGATTRHNGPDDPTAHVDEWTVATDVAWLTDARTRLTACGSVGEVRGLWEEAAQVQGEGRLTHDDAAAFKDEMTQRSTELTAAS